MPIKLANFGSIFNDVPFGDPSNIDNLPASENMDLIYYHLIHKGIFLRPGGGLLSTAHTDDDLNSIIQAVKESIQELRNGGFLP